MNPFEMVVAIIAIVMIAQVVKARMGVVNRHKGEDFIHRGPDPEADRLRAEVKALKDRVAVLERLAVMQRGSSRDVRPRWSGNSTNCAAATERGATGRPRCTTPIFI